MCALTPQIHACFLITDIGVKLLHTYMYVLLHKINASIFVEYKENGDNYV